MTGSGPTRLRMCISAPPAAGSAGDCGPRAGPEELCDSDWSHGCHGQHDLVTVCFQSLPQVTIDDALRSFIDSQQAKR